MGRRASPTSSGSSEEEHSIRVSYFQGPRTQVALILAVIPPGDDDFSLFSTEDYLSPQAMAEVKKSKGTTRTASTEVKPRRKPGEDFVMAPTIPCGTSPTLPDRPVCAGQGPDIDPDVITDSMKECKEAMRTLRHRAT